VPPESVELDVNVHVELPHDLEIFATRFDVVVEEGTWANASLELWPVPAVFTPATL